MSKGTTIAITAVCILAVVIIAGIVMVGTGMITFNLGSGNQGASAAPTAAVQTSVPVVVQTSVSVPTSPEQTSGAKAGSEILAGTWYGEETMSFAFGMVKANGKFTALCYEDGTADFSCYLYGLEKYGVSSDLPFAMKLSWKYIEGNAFEATAENGEIISFTCDGSLLYMEINPVSLNLIENDMAKQFANQDIPIHLYKQ